MSGMRWLSLVALVCDEGEWAAGGGAGVVNEVSGRWMVVVSWWMWGVGRSLALGRWRAVVGCRSFAVGRWRSVLGGRSLVVGR